MEKNGTEKNEHIHYANQSLMVLFKSSTVMK